MRSALWLGNYDFEMQESSVPEPGPGEVLVRVHGCGICTTDLHALDGLYDLYTPPRVLGHEYAGIVEAVGQGVDSVSVGDRAAVMPAVACGACRNCLFERNFLECLRPKRVGGFTEYARLPVEALVPLPAKVDLSAAILLEPLSACLRAMDTAGMPSGTTALITGAGPIGLLLLQLAKRSGAAFVMVSDLSQERRELARRLGADLVVDPTSESVVEASYDNMAGRGVQFAFEAAGVPSALNDCIDAVCHGGRIVMVGVNAETARVDLELYKIHRRELSIASTWGGWGTFERTVNWLGKLDLRPLISHSYGLSDIGAAFDMAKTDAAIKVAVGAGLVS